VHGWEEAGRRRNPRLRSSVLAGWPHRSAIQVVTGPVDGLDLLSASQGISTRPRVALAWPSAASTALGDPLCGGRRADRLGGLGEQRLVLVASPLALPHALQPNRDPVVFLISPEA